MAVTQIADENLALQFLEAASWSVDAAVADALDHPEGPPGGRRGPTSSASYSAVAARGVSSWASGVGFGLEDDVRRRSGRPSTQRTAGQPSASDRMSRAVTDRNVPVQARPSIISSFIWPIGFLWRTAWRLVFFAASFVPFLGTYLLRVTSGRREGRQIAPRPRELKATEVFRRDFESTYGTTHPTFHEDGYTQTLNHAKQELKFLLVILQSSEHDDTEAFNRTILSSSEFVAFCNKHDFLVWAADIKEPEALQVSSTLAATTYPFMGLIVYQQPSVFGLGGAGPAKMTTVERIEGWQPLDHVLRLLSAQYERCNPSIMGLRAERAEREAARRIREMQDAAYAESLKVDREKERRAAEERERVRLEEEAAQMEKVERAQWEEAKQRHRVKLLRALPPEPTGPNGIARLSFKLLSGERVVRRFRQTEPVENLYIYVDTLPLARSPPDTEDIVQDSTSDTLTAGGKFYAHSYDFVLVAPFPRKEYDQLSVSLEEAGGLCPSAGLIVEMADATEDER